MSRRVTIAGTRRRITVNGREFAVEDAKPLTIGRDPESDVHVDHPGVSWRHGVLKSEAQGWIFRDSSRNGTFRDGERVFELSITAGVRLLLAGPREGAVLEITVPKGDAGPQDTTTVVNARTQPSTLGRLSAVHEWKEPRVRIGRSPENDLVLTDDLLVSRTHAELIRHADGSHELVDLGSHNGTFVNGQRIQRATLKDLDVIGIGTHLFQLSEGKLEEYVDRGEAAFQANGLSVRTDDGRLILDDVSFFLEPSSLLAVVGPSGTGKTTLLNALTGFRPAQDGTVSYGGRDLYAEYEDLRHRMGYVPQEDILHSQLTIRRALGFAAQLRFPAEVSKTDRRKRVEEVMGELGLGERANQRIEKLSGGQRKRTSVGFELLTKPSLLFLDEPTSGLDPGNEEHVMRLLRQLADNGRIVVVVTHSVQSLDLCDRVLFLAPGGRVAYYGPPKEALDYFGRLNGADNYATVFRQLDDSKDLDWRSRFRLDPAHGRYVERAATGPDPMRRQPHGEARPPKRQPWLRQFSVLARRYLAVIGSDRRNVGLLALQAPFFAALFLLLFGPNRFEPRHGLDATMLIWLLVVGATWLGASNAIREIVKEFAIYRRERSVGLSVSAYIASKVAVLGLVTVVQCALLVGMVLTRQKLPPVDPTRTFAFASRGAVIASPRLELIVDIALAGLAAMALGLLISALVKTSDQALVVLPLLLVAQVVLSIPFLPNPSRVLEGLGYASSAQWGTAAAGSTVSLDKLLAPSTGVVRLVPRILGPVSPSRAEFGRTFEQERSNRPEWRNGAGTWLGNAGALVGLTFAFILGASWVLRRKDPDLLLARRLHRKPATEAQPQELKNAAHQR